MDRENIRKIPYEDLKRYTNDFSTQNYIGEFQFGNIYHGAIERVTPIPQYVTVKMWEVPKIYDHSLGDNVQRMSDELVLLRHEKLIHHPVMPKVYGFCWEGEHLGVVYEFKSLDTVKNLLPKDDFTWLQRIKVAVGFAHLLRFLHARNPLYEPFLIRNVDAAHIMVDEEHNPKLVDFGMVTGGIFPNRRLNQVQSYGCNGSVVPSSGMIGGLTEESDVYAFGVLLLCLITNGAFTEEDKKNDAPSEWAWKEHGFVKPKIGISESMPSLVHQSLEADPVFHLTDGLDIRRLAMQCMDYNPKNRPTIKQVVKCLLKLQVVQSNADSLGLDHVLRTLYIHPTI